MGWFETMSDCKIDQYHFSKPDTLRGIAETYNNEIVGATLVRIVFLLPMALTIHTMLLSGCVSLEPWHAVKDEAIANGTQKFIVAKGD